MRQGHPNIPRMYLYRLLSECLLIVPILIPLYVSRGLSATQVFVVQTIFTVGAFVFEVPSGYFADVMGRRVSLIAGSVFWIAGFGAYALAHSFAGFALAELLLAVGVSLRSGTDTALVYDSLAEAGDEEQFTHFQGKVELATRVGTAVASVAGGLLGAVSLELPVYINIGTGVLMLVTSFAFTEPRRRRPPYQSPLHGIRVVLVQSVRDTRLLLPMLIAGVMMSAGIIGIWSYLLLFEQQRQSAAVTGLIFAAFQLASGFGSRIAARLESRFGAGLVWSVFPLVGVGLLVVGLLPSTITCAAVMIGNGLIWGISGPLVMTRVNERTGAEVRATVISISSMLGRILYAAVSPLIGLAADTAGLPSAFLALGAFALVALVATLLAYARLNPRGAACSSALS